MHYYFLQVYVSGTHAPLDLHGSFVKNTTPQNIFYEEQFVKAKAMIQFL